MPELSNLNGPFSRPLLWSTDSHGIYVAGLDSEGIGSPGGSSYVGDSIRNQLPLGVDGHAELSG